MPANKLTPSQRQVVKQHLMTGASNAQVRQALAEQGFTGTLADSTLCGYRNAPEVAQARERFQHRLCQEAEATSFLHRQRQLEALDHAAQRAFARLCGQEFGAAPGRPAERPVTSQAFSMALQGLLSACREIRLLLKEAAAEQPPLDVTRLRAELAVSLRRELKIEVAHEFLDRIEREFGLASTRPEPEDVSLLPEESVVEDGERQEEGEKMGE